MRPEGVNVGGARILLVDDEMSSAEVLALVLASEGYEVTVAADGHQAMSRLMEADPDVLITDFMMPGMHGADLVHAVRKIERFKDLPIMMMSGAPESALRSYGAPYDVFLRKPFGLDDFLGALLSLRQGRP